MTYAIGKTPTAIANLPSVTQSAPMHRVYFDTNARTAAGAFLLNLAPALADLAAIPGGPQIGMRVVIHMPSELECEATLDFDPEHASWVGLPVAGTWRDLPLS